MTSRAQTKPEPQTQQQTNGSGEVAQTAPTGPRVPRREQWVELPAPYAELRIKVHVNYPGRLTGELESGDLARIRAAMVAIVTEHNGWLDEDGAPYPPASDLTFWEVLPPELLGVIVAVATSEAGRLPNLVAARRGL